MLIWLEAPSGVGSAKVLVVKDAVEDGWGYGKAIPSSLRLCWLGLQYRIFLWGLEPKEQGPPVMDANTPTSPGVFSARLL